MIRSLRHVEPTTSFRSAFTYTNVTHMLAGRVLAQAMGAADWPTLVETEILAPLGMTDSSLTAEAMVAAAKGTRGYVWTPDEAIEVPFIPIFPYAFAGAGAINSTVDDMAKWVRLLLADGVLRGRADRVGPEPRGHQDPAHRPRRPGRLCDGLVAAIDAERADHLAQRRHHQLRRLRGDAARQGRRRDRADQPHQRRLARRRRRVDARPPARQPRGRPCGDQARGGQGRRR